MRESVFLNISFEPQLTEIIRKPIVKPIVKTYTLEALPYIKNFIQCKGPSANFTSNIKQIEATYLTSIPLEIIRKPKVF